MRQGFADLEFMPGLWQTVFALEGMTMQRMNPLNITIPDAVLERIDRVASIRGMSRSAFIREAIVTNIAELEKTALTDNARDIEPDLDAV